MIKELFLAVVLGALLGLGVTGGFYVLNKNRNTTPTQNITPSATENQNSTITPTPTTPINNDLVINSPKNNTVVNTPKITVSGMAPSQSTIIATTASNSYNTTATSVGNFSIDIDLDSGINQIKITAIDSQDNQTDTQLNITYSSAKI